MTPLLTTRRPSWSKVTAATSLLEWLTGLQREAVHSMSRSQFDGFNPHIQKIDK